MLYKAFISSYKLITDVIAIFYRNLYLHILSDVQTLTLKLRRPIVVIPDNDTMGPKNDSEYL